MNSEQKANGWFEKWITPKAAIFGAFGLVVLGLLAASVPMLGCSNPTKLAELGGYWQGSTGSLWALAGLLFVLAAFLAQMEQLKKQDSQFATQQSSIERQNFESSFFQLLGLYGQVVSSLHLDPAPGSHLGTNGKSSFPVLRYLLTETIKGYCVSPQRNNPSLSELVKGYEIFYNKHSELLGHYFRTLYHMVKFVDESEIDNKRRYTSLIRAQLSEPELLLLCFNGLSKYGEKFKPLILKYELLEHLQTFPGFMNKPMSYYRQS